MRAETVAKDKTMTTLNRPVAPASTVVAQVVPVSQLPAENVIEPKAAPQFYVTITPDVNPREGVKQVAALFENSQRSPVVLDNGKMTAGFIGRTGDGKLIVYRNWEDMIASHRIEQPKAVVAIFCDRDHNISVAGKCAVIQGRQGSQTVYLAFLRSGSVTIDENVIVLKDGKPVYEHLLRSTVTPAQKPNKTGAASRKIKKSDYLAKKNAATAQTPQKKEGKGGKGKGK